MGRRKYSEHAALQVDQRAGSRQSKMADLVSGQVALSNLDNREGLRDLDSWVEQNRHATRAQKDAERNFARDTTAPLGHPKKDRRLLEPDAVRTNFSQRQRLQRLHAETGVLDSVSQEQFTAISSMVQDRQSWRDLNGALAETRGNLYEVDDEQKAKIQAVDQVIQEYEKSSDRGHRVYMNVTLPRGINSSNMEGFLKHYMPEGSGVDFDQFSAGSHNLSEISDNVGPRTVALEIHTRRGMFIGEPGDSHSNGHLLPRGLHLEVADIHEATYQRDDGTRGRRTLIQLVDPAADDTPDLD